MVTNGWKHLRAQLCLWNWLYLVKLCLALVFTLPILTVISAKIDYSTFAAPMLGEWSFDVVTELLGTSPDLVPVFLSVLLFYAMVMFLIGQFLNGGIYTSFLSHQRLGVREFFAEGAGLFKTNLKVSLLMLAPYAVLFVVFGLTSALVPSDLTGHFGLAAVGGLGLRAAILYWLFIFGSIYSQIMRLILTGAPDLPILRAVRPALDFYLRRVVKLNGIYYLYFVPFVLVWLLVEYACASLTGALGSLVGVMIEMFLFQACSWLRTGQSLAFAATAAPLVRAAYPGRFGVNAGERAVD